MLSQLKFEENENCSKTDNKIRSKLKVTVHDLLQFLFSWLSIVYVCLQARAKHQNVNGFIRNSESKIWMTVCWFRRQRNHSKWMNIEWISFAWARYCRRDVVHESEAHGKFEATLRVECSLTLHTSTVANTIKCLKKIKSTTEHAQLARIRKINKNAKIGV